MTKHELLATSETLEAHIAKAATTRIAMQPQLQTILNRLEADGIVVPGRLKRLNATLIDEAIEARFDNMPI